MYELTIFTATYNRSELLIRLYESLCRQSKKDFEWIIVDDQSSDNTQQTVKKFDSEKVGFEIRYYRQEHGGKHRALNKGFQLAKGEYFFIVDDDDYLTDNAVELVLQWVSEIRGEKRFAGVAGVRVSSSGTIWGGKPEMQNREWVDASNFERQKYHLYGDKAEIYKTEILRKHPFPEYEGEYFVTEAVCWDAIADEGYKIRWYNEPIYVCEYLEQGLTRQGANVFAGHRKNYQGYCYYIRQCLRFKSKKNILRDFLGFEKTRRRLGKSLSQAAYDLEVSALRYMFYLLIELPFRYIIYILGVW